MNICSVWRRGTVLMKTVVIGFILVMIIVATFPALAQDRNLSALDDAVFDRQGLQKLNADVGEYASFMKKGDLDGAEFVMRRLLSGDPKNESFIQTIAAIEKIKKAGYSRDEVARNFAQKWDHLDGQAKNTYAEADIRTIISTALLFFKMDVGRYPTTQEGLNALLVNPAVVLKWKGPYCEALTVDPWGRSYQYYCPGRNGAEYDLFSLGPDGVESADDIVYRRK